MPEQTGQDDHPPSNDVLDDVASWLDRFVSLSSTAGPDPQRLCRDAGSWIREVRREMHELRTEFESGADARVAAENLAAAVARLGHRVEGISGHAKDLLRDFGRKVEGPAPAHVEGANEIRESVAELRRRLREERAEQSRLAAEERRAFINRLRGTSEEPTPSPEPDVHDESDADASIAVEPSSDVRTSAPAATTPAPSALPEPATTNDVTIPLPPEPSDALASSVDTSANTDHAVDLDVSTRDDDASSPAAIPAESGPADAEPEAGEPLLASQSSLADVTDGTADDRSPTPRFTQVTDPSDTPPAPTTPHSPSESASPETQTSDAERAIRFRRVG